jgi:DNA-binding transcriptional LysR family regulator
MTLLSYEIFQSIIDNGSFAKAAAALHLTPSAVSHSISSMEEEIGFPLFIRSKTGVQLTSAGEEVSPYIQKIVASNNALSQAVSQMQGLQTGTVRIGCTNTVCLTWIPNILKSFQKEYPQIDVEIFQGSYDDVINWIKNGNIEIGIISEEANEKLPFTPLYKESLVCLVPKGYMPKEKKFMTPEDLKDQPFVIQQDSCDVDVINYLSKYRLSVRANCHILDDQSAIAMVECGAGISIMPALILQTSNLNVDVYTLEPKQYRTLGICTGSNEFLPPAAKVMIAHIKDYVRGLEGSLVE